jgi:hypothetical protein
MLDICAIYEPIPILSIWVTLGVIPAGGALSSLALLRSLLLVIILPARPALLSKRSPVTLSQILPAVDESLPLA